MGLYTWEGTYIRVFTVYHHFSESFLTWLRLIPLAAYSIEVKFLHSFSNFLSFFGICESVLLTLIMPFHSLLCIIFKILMFAVCFKMSSTFLDTHQNKLYWPCYKSLSLSTSFVILTWLVSFQLIFSSNLERKETEALYIQRHNHKTRPVNTEGRGWYVITYHPHIIAWDIVKVLS